MSDASRNSLQFPQLRLFVPAEGDNDDGALSPQITLSQLFWRWFKPICLEGENDADSTIKEYVTSIGYWIDLTGDPPLLQIDEFTVAGFKKALHQVLWKRGPLGTPRPLAEHTIAKHLKQIRAVLRRAGPTTHPDRPGKLLVAQVPHIRVSKPRCLPKKPFPLEVARRITLASQKLPATDKMIAGDARRWWIALLQVLYFTGVRIGTALKLEWPMVSTRADGHWLVIPGAIIDKTGKPLEKYLHDDAFAAIEQLRTEASRVLLWPHCRRYLSTIHDDLQALAGIPDADRLSPQAWRRTHGTEMARVGAKFGIRIAQAALDHEDERTTRASYVDIEPELIRQLPALVVPNAMPARPDPQRLLFG